MREHCGLPWVCRMLKRLPHTRGEVTVTAVCVAQCDLQSEIGGGGPSCLCATELFSIIWLVKENQNEWAPSMCQSVRWLRLQR